MAQLDWTLFLALLLGALSAAFAALAVLGRDRGRGRPASPLSAGDDSADAVFLFDQTLLIDASDGARGILRAADSGGDDWATLHAYLGRHFDGIAEAVATLPTARHITLAGRGASSLQLDMEDLNGLTRLALTERLAEGRDTRMDRLSLAALDDELATLRGIAEHLPALVWRQSADGAVSWANRAYVQAVEKAHPGPLGWPLAPIFPTAGLPGVGGAPRRLQLAASSGQPADRPLWFDCQAFALADEILFVAQPADAAARAETALKEFVQTLTKTFAHLPIGLAIFDRQRQLALFNPALIDLTAMSGDFLSRRPTLLSFLDTLRENRMMPEPKDYRSWRQQMTALEIAAASGQYCETWTLPSGQTYKVTGRPHPDGAMALLFEDVSAEVSLTRRFRSRIEIGQSLLDTLPEGLAVFSHTGAMDHVNAAFVRLWSPTAPLAGDLDLPGALRMFQDRCQASPVWTALHDYAVDSGARHPWTAEVVTLSGTVIRCRFAPLQGGGTMAGFMPAAAAEEIAQTPARDTTAAAHAQRLTVRRSDRSRQARHPARGAQPNGDRVAESCDG